MRHAKGTSDYEFDITDHSTTGSSSMEQINTEACEPRARYEFGANEQYVHLEQS